MTNRRRGGVAMEIVEAVLEARHRLRKFQTFIHRNLTPFPDGAFQSRVTSLADGCGGESEVGKVKIAQKTAQKSHSARRAFIPLSNSIRSNGERTFRRTTTVVGQWECFLSYFVLRFIDETSTFSKVSLSP
jgi:hypothetical protein